jgi:hypothetical protein
MNSSYVSNGLFNNDLSIAPFIYSQITGRWPTALRPRIREVAGL